jgi:hypothetical protein
LHASENEEQIKFSESLIPFSLKSYAFSFANYIKIKIYRLIILCGCRTWSTTIMGRIIIQAEGVPEYGAEEDVWA